jgi:hypothetical protein
MLDILAKIYEDGGRLVDVAYTLFGGDQHFVTAIGLRFESVSAVFRAVSDDDTLALSLGPLLPSPEETVVAASGSHPWSECAGLGVRWAWRLTNQQGYSDGVRLEFSEPGQVSRAVVEMVVVASAIHLFVAVRSGAE